MEITTNMFVFIGLFNETGRGNHSRNRFFKFNGYSLTVHTYFQSGRQTESFKD